MSREHATIFLVDDDASVRKGVGRLLRAHGFTVETFAAPGEFLQCAHPAGPCCAVLDVHLPGLNGLDVQAQLASAARFIPIIFITGQGDVPTSVRAIKAGAVDFLLKPFSATTLLQAVDDALSRSGRAKRLEENVAELRKRLRLLTPREIDVFEGVVSGAPNKQIASHLGISEQTVKIHRGKVMRKMGAQSLAELVQFAATVRNVSSSKAPQPSASGRPWLSGGWALALFAATVDEIAQGPSALAVIT